MLFMRFGFFVSTQTQITLLMPPDDFSSDNMKMT